MNRKLSESIEPVLAVALLLLAVYIAAAIGGHPPDEPIQFNPLPLSVILILLGVGIGKQIRKHKLIERLKHKGQYQQP